MFSKIVIFTAEFELLSTANTVDFLEATAPFCYIFRNSLLVLRLVCSLSIGSDDVPGERLLG